MNDSGWTAAVDPEAVEAAGKVGIEVYFAKQVFGPVSGAMGVKLQKMVEDAGSNVAAIVKNATRKMGTGNVIAPGRIPPRVIARIVDDGAFVEDTLMVDYLGGVLASSKTPEGKDDRGVMWSSQVGRMSTFELKTHYLVYKTLRTLLLGDPRNIGDAGERSKSRLFVPVGPYASALQLDPAETWPVMTSACAGLTRAGLLGDEWQVGGDLSAIAGFPSTEGDQRHGAVVEPTVPGVELFLWAHGLGSLPIQSFLLADVELDLEGAPEPLNNACVIGAT